VTIHDIAREGEMDVALIQSIFPDKTALVDFYMRWIDRQLVQDCVCDESEGEKDRLFEVFMARFDILNDNRAASLSILNALTMSPSDGLKALPFLSRSIARMMEMAKIQKSGWEAKTYEMGLALMYLKLLRDWARDDTSDMAETMASLDQALGFVERASSKINQSSL
jgi:hypothetical protein